MKFLNIRFPEEISYGAKGGPEFSTSIVTVQNGSEYRNINWELPRMVYNIGYDFLNKEKARQLNNFFYITKGRGYSFRFKDWLDFESNIEEKNFIAINEEKTKFQLIKTYAVGNLQSIRRITKPVENSIIINYKYSDIDYNQGIITFLQPIDEKFLKLSFTFDVPVRFEHDYYDLVNDEFELYSCKNIKLIEVRE